MPDGWMSSDSEAHDSPFQKRRLYRYDVGDHNNVYCRVLAMLPRLTPASPSLLIRVSAAPGQVMVTDTTDAS